MSVFYVFHIRCQCPDGGFGGGPGQRAHLAPTYAAINTLCIIGTEKAYNVINRYGSCFIKITAMLSDTSVCLFSELTYKNSYGGSDHLMVHFPCTSMEK